MGQDFFIAPVLAPQVEVLTVYLPADEWVHLWSQGEYGSTTTGTKITIPAPLGQPPVFYRRGSEFGLALVDRLKKTSNFVLEFGLKLIIEGVRSRMSELMRIAPSSQRD